MFKLMGKKIIKKFAQIKFPYLDLCYIANNINQDYGFILKVRFECILIYAADNILCQSFGRIRRNTDMKLFPDVCFRQMEAVKILRDSDC